MKPKPEATEDQSAQAVDPATPLFEPERPRRRFVLKLSLGADSYEEMTSALYNIAREFDRREIGKDMASGSPSSGFSLEWSEDESVTHDSYMAAIDEYLGTQSSNDLDQARAAQRVCSCDRLTSAR